MRSPASIIPVGATRDIVIRPGLPARIYRPGATGPLPTVVFFHGGGFVIGDVDTHDHLCRWICRDAGVVVVSAGYRLAPEEPFPAAVDDCMATLAWAAEQVRSLGGDPDRLAVAGDSAGGNLAAVAAQICRDQGAPRLAAQLLVCPATDLDADAIYQSRVDNATGYYLTVDDLRWFAGCYLGPADDPASPRLSPIRGTLRGLPPAVVVTAGFDPLRDEGDAYAKAMAAAGVPVIHHRFDALIHGFFDMTTLSPACAAAVSTMCVSLRDLLTR